MSFPAIRARSAWGFPGWSSAPYAASARARTEFFVHYEGGTPTRNTGAVAMRSIDAGHRARGWSGIGYNFVVMQDGSAWEGRGWDLVGAHCPNHNTSGIGVQIHIGGAQQPTAAALTTCRQLYDEACRRSGRTLARRGHRDGIATECPGAALYGWVRAGLPLPAAVRPIVPPLPTPHPPEDSVLFRATSASLDGTVPKGAVLSCSLNQRWHIPGGGAPVVAAYEAAGLKVVSVAGQDIADAFPVLAGIPLGVTIDVPALADALAARLPAGWDAREIAAAVVADLSARLAQ